ncbi:EAL domain-containing protein [Devosia sp.]|uniref:bifunctional diguanylate cyclase/phosphodiesterase n=1 Tax=Devosia sp. TaxID=1871048 RepID=UPI0025C37049|nr:EAL domain-containing protein [Devosia sp.]
MRQLTVVPLRSRWFGTLVTFAGILMLGWYASWQNQVLFEEQARADVLKEVSVVRARLEGHINGNIQLVRGLVATISTEPGMTQARFAELAAKILDSDSELRNIAGAPDFVVRLLYPLVGNERAIGLDYRHNEAQNEAVMRARETGQLVLAGPVDLVQGGSGFIARFPVFTGAGETRQFWGIVSAVVDVDRLYAASGLTDPGLGVQIAIAGRDGLGRRGALFYGPAEVFDQAPVIADIELPAGQWEIAAIPKGGWAGTPRNAWLIWAGFLALAVIVCVPVYYTGRLLEERRRHLMALKSREVELQRLSRRLGLALETSAVGVFEFDLDTGRLLWDDRINALFGLPQDGGARDYGDWCKAVHPADLARAEEEFRIATAVTGRYHSEYRIVTPQGVTRNVRAIGAVYQDAGGTRRIIGVNWDVSDDVALNESLKEASRLSEARYAELEAAKASIEHNALHDSLTGLPNRRYLDRVLAERAAQASETGMPLALLHIDLDRFKQINDTLGHAAGDATLVHASHVLRANTRADDFVARIGGDEFVIVSSADSGDAGLAILAQRIIVKMRQPVDYHGHQCRCGVSVGIARQTGKAADPARLLVDADIALYRAKSRGRNRHEFFTEALQAEVVRTKRVADELLGAIERDQFVPYFQPQFDARTREVVGVEALVRWQHPVDGLLGPAAFLDVAEDLNIVSTIDRIVLEKSMAAFRQWRALGLDVGRIAVNVSARRLQDEQLIESLKHLEIEPGTVSFELVESIFLDETDDLVRFNADQLKELGIDIEIDDFGTGYASIVSLQKLKPRRLKIDRQLVKPIVSSEAQRNLVASIVDIGRALGIEVVGEGVETLEHADILRDLGCTVLQGYALARPMSGLALAQFLPSHAARKLARPRRARA